VTRGWCRNHRLHPQGETELPRSFLPATRWPAAPRTLLFERLDPPFPARHLSLEEIEPLGVKLQLLVVENSHLLLVETIRVQLSFELAEAPLDFCFPGWSCQLPFPP